MATPCVAVARSHAAYYPPAPRLPARPRADLTIKVAANRMTINTLGQQSAARFGVGLPEAVLKCKVSGVDLGLRIACGSGERSA